MTVDEVTNSAKKEESRRRGRRRGRQLAMASPENAVQQPPRKDRPTPARRESGGRGNIVARSLRVIADYFSATRAELQKVTWPTREESLRLSGIVIAVTVIASVALGVLDFLYGELFRLGFNAPVIFVVFAVVLLGIVGGGIFWLRRRSGY